MQGPQVDQVFKSDQKAVPNGRLMLNFTKKITPVFDENILFVKIKVKRNQPCAIGNRLDQPGIFFVFQIASPTAI